MQGATRCMQRAFFTTGGVERVLAPCVRRAEVELSGSQTLTIPIEMRVGGLEETITVTGETPVVDVQSARRELVFNSEVVQTIPATRAAGALLNATPGINVSDSGLSMSPAMTSFSARSSGANTPRAFISTRNRRPPAAGSG